VQVVTYSKWLTRTKGPESAFVGSRRIATVSNSSAIGRMRTAQLAALAFQVIPKSVEGKSSHLPLNRQYPPVVEPDKESNSEENKGGETDERNPPLLPYVLLLSGDH